MEHLNTGPELLRTDDPDGMSLAVGRHLLKSGKGSEAQQSRFSKFYFAYDAAAATGRTRAECVAIAKSRAGLS